ncbi:MAG: DUF3127 domain-containing protein [Bacteroidia bacterium]|nr:DUF3127 domain-containing protein [Bacteroidia bacterium]MCZ2277894.1 DUF3127 domain-containing protein [Bacteroidia bacterium]
MSLEITGTLLQIMEEVKGQSQRGNWNKQEFVIETIEDKFPRKICFSLWGEKTASLKNLQIGSRIKVDFNLESREFNGRWYTEARAWMISSLDSAVPSTPMTNSGLPPAPSEIETAADSSVEDDLPF